MTDTLKPDEVRFEILDGIEYATLHADAFRAAMNERDALAREAIGMKAAWMEARREVEYLKRLQAALEGMLALYAPSALSGEMAPGNQTVASALELVRPKK